MVAIDPQQVHRLSLSVLSIAINADHLNVLAPGGYLQVCPEKARRIGQGQE